MGTVELNAQVSGDGPPLVILHGLFGSARNWGAIQRGLADVRQVHALDLRNHGSSPWEASMTYPEMAADIARYIETRGLMPCDVLGHSMGGKTAMTLALTQPELVDRLIVVDIAPVAYIRDHFGAYLQAMRSVDLPRVTRRSDVDTALAHAIADPALRAFLLQNIVSTDSGFRWRINLDGIEPNLPAIIGFPEIEATFDGTTAFFAGEHSDYIRPRDMDAIRRLFPSASVTEIGGTGHWPHADKPDRFLSLVRKALGA
ncbi:MAG: alpha/beta fold hydrolase [Telmatospirillum sp.]|nr:alpha/beta fold hydrolase [Telmatospirillum sp.]